MVDLDIDLPDLARRIGRPGNPVLLDEADAEAATGCNGSSPAAIAQLLDTGWLAVWEHEGTPWLHLTSVAAEALGLHSAPDLKGVDRWWLRDEARDLGPGKDGKARPESDVYGADGGLDGQADPDAPEPWKILADLELDPVADACLDARMKGDEQHAAALAAWRKARAKRVPKPSIIMTGACAWPPSERPDGACPVCKGHSLRPSVACGWCLASGVDDLLPEIPEADRPKEYVYSPEPWDLAGGTGPSLGMDEAEFDALMAATKADADAYKKKRAREAQESRKKARAKKERAMGFRARKTG